MNLLGVYDVAPFAKLLLSGVKISTLAPREFYKNRFVKVFTRIHTPFYYRLHIIFYLLSIYLQYFNLPSQATQTFMPLLLYRS